MGTRCRKREGNPSSRSFVTKYHAVWECSSPLLIMGARLLHCTLLHALHYTINLSLEKFR